MRPPWRWPPPTRSPGSGCWPTTAAAQLTAEQAAVTATSLQYAHDGLGSDHDSVNTFQQRWIAGWGTVAQLMDPVYAAAAFYGRLVEVPNWRATAHPGSSDGQVSAAGRRLRTLGAARAAS